ncbi:MAG: 3-oxoacyl-ACP synthase III family protein [Bacillota bacterium]
MLNNVGIIGYGYFLPELVVSNSEIAKHIGKTANWIEERTGIRERRKAEYNISTSDIAVNAAVSALDKANIKAGDIDLIIVATTTPDMIFPSTACLVQSRIAACNAAAFDISAACSGFMYGFDIAVSYVASGRYKKILLIGADTYSKIVNYKDPQTSILFGDGAGAVVIGEVPKGFGVITSFLGADGSGGDSLKVPGGGSKMPLTHELLDQKINTIVMNGREVYQFAVKIIDQIINQAVHLSGITIEDISLIIPHQANKRILQSVADRLRLPPEKLYCNIEYYGNMSSASIPVALSEACIKKQIKTGDLVLLIGFGAGLTWGASLMKWYS